MPTSATAESIKCADACHELPPLKGGRTSSPPTPAPSLLPHSAAPPQSQTQRVLALMAPRPRRAAAPATGA
eukprot:CAMPEP_0202870252 /NCGR_PEP_ID=MMETSP1391-20130828/15123_1 /ASSEMBLY_ACC=CAM_ASM_000867 /TAXON_ID=1034604 /ORGANISM="Chlamydomonas leiostraca, Strain SAG 11-49" /LENGTH=70 /DNA_ID=CAMNT_0049550769 /DNA_START=403 /DNA_END=611 /DNA_ORIENTATION=-